MRFPFRRAPEAAGAPGEALIMEVDPGRVRLALSIQTAWNGSLGILRGLRENGRLLEDHILEGGRRIFGDAAMRRQVWTVEQHLAAYPDVVAMTGNGNLLANPHFVAARAGSLYHLAGEPVATRQYSCLVARRGRISIEPLTTDCEFATFGQQIVRAGEPIAAGDLRAKAAAGEFYDLRHLFLFPRLRLGGDRWIDPGRDSVDAAAVLGGRAIEADVSAFRETEVREALAAKGYEEYELRAGILTYMPRPGIYPHQIAGVRGDGSAIFVLVRGLSNRAGVSIGDAAEAMAELGARDAVIIDNGGDVMLWRGGWELQGRARLRSALLFRAPTGHCPAVTRLEC